MATNAQDILMLFGDSITQGAWEPGLDPLGQRLSHVYARKLDVLNRGFSGYNTDWALPVFEQCIQKHPSPQASKIRILTIWFGANDACIRPSPQHVPLERFKENLRKMVQMVKSPNSEFFSPGTRVILLTPPPVNTHQRRADLESRNPPLALDRLFETTRSYAEAVLEIGNEQDVTTVDVWTLIWEAANRDEAVLDQFLVDGLHLNSAGYQIVYEQLDETIRRRHPEVHHENIPPTFPLWADINWNNPNESLYVNKMAH
ncbi:hypothetical protein AGABI2DRAFT_190796 [Agaricus bisporus var. bisporus H97]|uniref:hypothetical protein n=1 Tax=Agaricus bisporus var. bisporus (strain H97 / ATCC MYA-4626 / FGSC 10389) TaxID=936046 RepID=UPI00029F6C62|nr:hypothetical protein AGABI2DRAFT_190796 [Agaricus bisporus var. bisporus H97]EKV50477.1 hypothetical protein AGABI2DRAFT_190796 [Agaricus bisporus var. bisporus H97]